MGGVEVRKLRAGEERAFVASERVPFLKPAVTTDDEAADERQSRNLPLERCWVADDGGRVVGQCLVLSMDLTVPAPDAAQDCSLVGMGGVSAVGVHPTHRRQGILSRMMAEMLADCRRRGEAVAGLIASESVIYGRFGFGLASDSAAYRIDRRDAVFRTPAPALSGLRLLDQDEARKELPGAYDRLRRRRAGEPSRSASWWESWLAADADRRDGGRGLFFAVADDGYLLYRAHDSDWAHGERQSVVIEELRGASAEIEAALWRFVLDLDLVDGVTAQRRPVDEPLRWRLTDPRKLQVASVEDRLYLRVLDVAAALEGRGYQGSGRVIFEVAGADGDPVSGRWVLDAAPDGASCRRATPGEAPGLRLDVAALGSLYLGAYRPSLLAAGKRLEELRPGALHVADRVFVTAPAPCTGTGF